MAFEKKFIKAASDEKRQQPTQNRKVVIFLSTFEQFENIIYENCEISAEVGKQVIMCKFRLISRIVYLD